MKNLIKIIPIVILSTFITNCNHDNALTVNLESILIAKSNLYGAGAEGISQQNLVITDQESWSNLMTQMNSVNNVTDTFSEIDIDFSAHQIIAAFDEIKGSGGHQITLDIVANPENIIVTVTSLAPEGLVPLIITQPFHIVKIPVSSLPVIFE